MLNVLIQYHKQLFLWMYSFTLTYPKYNNLIHFIADKLDNYVILLAAIVLFYFVYKSIEYTSWKRFYFLIKEGIRLVVVVCISWSISYLIKNIVRFPRPFLRFPNEVTQLFDYGGFNSFPSGHATLFMALAVIVSLHHKHIGYLFIFFAIIISIARVMSGIHFPIDILAGWIIGGGISLLVYRVLKLVN